MMTRTLLLGSTLGKFRSLTSRWLTFTANTAFLEPRICVLAEVVLSLAFVFCHNAGRTTCAPMGQCSSGREFSSEGACLESSVISPGRKSQVSGTEVLD